MRRDAMTCPTCQAHMTPAGYWVDHCENCGTVHWGGSSGGRIRVRVPAQAKSHAALRAVCSTVALAEDHAEGCCRRDGGRRCDCWVAAARAALALDAEGTS
jgi:hypothetical protein